jgi:hypothetical protein
MNLHEQAFIILIIIERVNASRADDCIETLLKGMGETWEEGRSLSIRNCSKPVHWAKWEVLSPSKEAFPCCGVSNLVSERADSLIL